MLTIIVMLTILKNEVQRDYDVYTKKYKGAIQRALIHYTFMLNAFAMFTFYISQCDNAKNNGITFQVLKGFTAMK